MVDLDAQRDTPRGSFLHESQEMKFSSPLFSALARGCAEDEAILELCTATRRGQPIAVLMLVAAQYLLFRSPQEKLAAYFPSMTATPGPTEEAFPVFREFCLERRAELMNLLATRTLNANLVERASSILAAFQHIHRSTGEALTLVEICCSAGFNLLFDEYYYDYGVAGRLGNEDSTVRLSCKIVGDSRPPIDAIPPVVERVGVDLVTVDCSDPDQRLWMEAQISPEWREERERVRKALALRAARSGRFISGDAVAVLPTLLEELTGPVVVLHSYCMGQWFAAAQDALDKIFRYASRRRDIHRIGLEVPGTEPAEVVRSRLAMLSKAKIPIWQKCLPARIDYTRYAKGTAEGALLGYADGFGAWLDWRA